MPGPRRILVDHHGNKGIGDIVCELNYYRALRQRYPQAVLASRQSRTLAWGNPEVDMLDETSPDEAFDLIIRQPSLRPIVDRLKDALERQVTIFDLFLEHQGFAPVEGRPELFVLEREVEVARKLCDPDRLTVVVSADSKEPDRRWGFERFQQVARYLAEVHGAHVIELGSGLSEGHLGVGLDLVGKTNLREAMAILSEADFFLGNNGGLTHLAGGVGTPILVPWGANSPYEAYAYDEISVALGTAPYCRNCGWTGDFRPSCLNVDLTVGRTPCTQDISVDDMLEAADELIAYVRLEREALRQGKDSRSSRARDPRGLERFDASGPIDLYAYPLLSLGGNGDWFQDHQADRFARLRKIVAFPDWGTPVGEHGWQPLLTAYLDTYDAGSDWVLVLTASPLTAPQVRSILEPFVGEHVRPGESVPKILVYIGGLSAAERATLSLQAEVYVRTWKGDGGRKIFARA